MTSETPNARVLYTSTPVHQLDLSGKLSTTLQSLQCTETIHSHVLAVYSLVPMDLNEASSIESPAFYRSATATLHQ